MEELGCASADAYIQELERMPAARAECERRLLVSISRFFRDRQLWRMLGQHTLPELIERFQPPIRVWSAGCACGEEPYTLAMLWKLLPQAPDLEILATDADAQCLDRARAGLYGRGSLREVPEDLRLAFFESRKGGRQFQIKSHLLAKTNWRRHRMQDPPPQGFFHALFMRNSLLTYYQGPARQATFERVLTRLLPGGYLIVGAHEKPPASSLPLVRDDHCPWVYKLNRCGPSY